MSNENENSINYFLLGNTFTRKQIGSYTDNPYDSEAAILNQIIEESSNIFQNASMENVKNIKQKKVINNYILYYTVTNADTFYLASIKKGTKFSREENLIYELFEDLEHQGIKKLVDKNGELTRVGKQNLKFCIDQAQQDNSYSNNSSIRNFFKKEEEKPSKITLLNNTIKDISQNMKTNVQNMITNVNDLQDLDNKSTQIRDISYQFQANAHALEQKLRCRKYMSKGILIGFGLLVFLFLFYKIFL